MTRIIVTGADGFVGSRTVEKLLSVGKEVLAIDLAERPARLNFKQGAPLYFCRHLGYKRVG